MKEQKKENIINWHSERKESPYLYLSEYPKYEYIDFTWKFVDQKEILSEEKYKGEFLMCLEMWDLHLLTELRVSFLLRPFEFRDKNDNRIIEFLELINLEDDLLNEEIPVKLYISYPFSKTIELTIFPVKMTVNSKKTYNISSLGYIAWQVSKLYGTIYQSYSEESGIWGHGFSDLQLSSIRIFEDNIMSLGVSS